MLEKPLRERLLDRLGTPSAGMRLILDAVKYAPVRKVESRGGGNVITPLQSRKMQRTVETESRHLEFPVAVSLEHDPAVLEYYPQPSQLKFEVIDADGEIHAIDHIPDFLVVTEREVWFLECKPWSKLEKLAQRYPWRYQLDPDNHWRAPLIEEWLAARGIGYRIQTDRDIPQRRIENTLFLEDYLDPSAPPCPVDIAVRVQEALVADATLYLAELYDKADCRPDEVFKLIADGQLVAEIDFAALSEPTRCRVFRDTAVRDFERARQRPTPFAIPGVVDIKVGAHLVYDQQPYKVVLVGGSKVILESEDGKSVETELETLEKLVAQQNLLITNEASLGQEPVRLSDYTESELKMALSRLNGLENISLPNRTQRRHLKALGLAKLAGADELIALVPRLRDRGNRNPRLSPEQESAMEQVIRDEYLTSNAPNARHCHRKLVILCAQLGIKAPSYPTLIERIEALPQKQADRARHGNRVAYQNAEFVNVLHADTPVHGSRAFQYVHMDHTELDIELVSAKNGKPLGRPWLSFAIDAFTRRILGLYLSYDPPSYRSNMMLLRDIVRRHRRLPQFIVVDNGADFRSEDFKHFCALMRIHLRYRPAGRPRHGSVMERIFGRAHTEYVHNLAGNTKAMKAVRSTTGKFLPSRLAEWTLQAMYYGLEYWAFTYYDNEVHSALGLSPHDAFMRSQSLSGSREHRIVTLTQDFLILTCPTVSRAGLRTVDRQRGIKVHANYFYWCPEFCDPKMHGKKLPVRYDPWDGATVYVQINKRWVPAQCKALVNLGQLTEKERELLSQEMRARYRMDDNDEPSLQRLTEFMQVFTPEGAMALAFQRQQENRELYQGMGIGAIAPPTSQPAIAPASIPTQRQALDSANTVNEVPPYQLTTANPSSDDADDIPELDIFWNWNNRL
ncbi:Mu transposase C-terminal domain-containing protein [Chromobacterium haemolyticum]|uniref:Mu transposase C-terminal domain-containing protein n=1 Tax=Chromobacterium haemolyticum TaxID=394935 RepID=UPI0005BB56BB|nr:Mu transposase C-terminal domain-containing protein [Chromobacterium haemolyticum]